MIPAQLATFASNDGNVILAWSVTDEQGKTSTHGVSLPPETAYNLGRTLVANSAKAFNIQDLFGAVDEILTNTPDQQ